jgi:hypothetical protein
MEGWKVMKHKTAVMTGFLVLCPGANPEVIGRIWVESAKDTAQTLKFLLIRK